MVSQWSTICKADLVDAGLRDHIQGRSCTRSNEKTPARCNRGAIGSLHVVSDCTLDIAITRSPEHGVIDHPCFKPIFLAVDDHLFTAN